MLFECDLYSRNRSKLINCLNNIPFNYPDSEVNTRSHNFNLNALNLKDQLKHILSPNTVPDTASEEWVNSIHCPSTITTDHNSPLHTCFQNRRSYAITNICTYILKCFEERIKFNGDARRESSEMRQRNNIVVNIMSS